MSAAVEAGLALEVEVPWLFSPIEILLKVDIFAILG
jgi:hypothetical protein